MVASAFRHRAESTSNPKAPIKRSGSTCGSDWATSPLNPLIQIADTLHRETRIDGVVRPWDESNTLNFQEALHGYTQAGADMTTWAGEIGSISVGKWADFVILDENVPDDIGRALENRQVSATYLAGERVYP